jgi:hypothetical protein
MVQSSNEDTPVTKTAVTEFDTPKLSEPTLNLVPAKFPELKLPKFDLDALFSVQTANLAAAHQVQSVLVEAAQAVARLQHGYVEQAIADVKAALGTKPVAKPEAAQADVKAAAEKAIAVGKEVVDLTVAAQKRVAELVSERVQASVTELKALTA